jgi:septal ring factor EnvC (AmiA/AmiB activator)
MALNNSKTLLIAVTAVLLTFLGNGVISFITSNRVADKVVTEDHIRVEYITQQISDIEANIIKLDENKVEKEAFNSMVITLKEQLEVMRQLIIAMERQNKTEYYRFQKQYDDLEKQFQENVEKYKLNKTQNQVMPGGVIR